LRYLFALMFTFISLFADTIKFSPLPMDKSSKIFLEYTNMLKYLEKETGYQFEFVYSSSYEELLNNFKNGKIDIIELGPLPYVKLKENCKYADPFLTFKSKEGKASYTCDILTTNTNMKNLNDVFNQKKKNKIILTRKLSTCGQLMTEYIFNDYNQTLKNFEYNFVGTHSNVLLNLLLKENSIGTVKSTVANKYKHLKFNKIAQSPDIPGFTFIANKNKMTRSQINTIQNAILKLHPLSSEYDKEIVHNWSENTKYGAIKTKKDAYSIVYKAIIKVEISGAKTI
jgi:phosphonate transport system substrate-binding protein